MSGARSSAKDGRVHASAKGSIGRFARRCRAGRARLGAVCHGQLRRRLRPAASDADAEALRDEVKFAELTAATLSSLRESRLLAARQASLSQFFSPVVLDALGLAGDAERGASRRAKPT